MYVHKPSAKPVKIQTTTLDNKIVEMGYRVVTSDMKSLGLRNNPNILTYKLQEWIYLPEEKVVEGNGDWGGIWVTRTLSDGKKLMKYMAEKHGKETKIFTSAVDRILFANNYRLKTNGIYLMEELNIKL